ncbi:hypothetical protein [Niallia circulans]|uniref:hypothetical protein n=1 Tax=Niallia circulans TaxID=1397 RepID=UPI0015957EBA|nr:hypothetical protein [Niallia circulans]
MEIRTTGRNKYDMIMELVALHVAQTEKNRNVTPEEIEEIYLKYVKLVKNI